MSSTHPSWVYESAPSGSPSDPAEYAKAVEEDRRALALELAVKSLENATGLIGGQDYISRAKAFEWYLKGEDA